MTEKKINVLVVDDEERVLSFFTEASKRLSVEVTTCKTGREAIEEVKKESFRMIFLDTQMPGMDGLVTFKTIKSINPNIAVFMMATSATDSLLKAALEEGARGAFYKPLELEGLVDIVQKMEIISFVKAELERAMTRTKSVVSKEREKIEKRLRDVEKAERKK